MFIYANAQHNCWLHACRFLCTSHGTLNKWFMWLRTKEKAWDSRLTSLFHLHSRSFIGLQYAALKLRKQHQTKLLCANGPVAMWYRISLTSNKIKIYKSHTPSFLRSFIFYRMLVNLGRAFNVLYVRYRILIKSWWISECLFMFLHPPSSHHTAL